MPLSKRPLIALWAALITAPALPALASEADLRQSVERIETKLKIRVGLSVIEHGGDFRLDYRADERFAMASTFKALACAAALDGGDPVLDQHSTIARKDLLSHSPVTERQVGARLSTRDLCAITLETSDNAAANLILKTIGGPKALTAFLRAKGDAVTRLDRFEPDLNQATPGDPRDTTTPRAMAATLERLLLGEALPPPARRQLEDWMAANAVSAGMLRSVLPEGWTIADRSGAGGHGTRGLIAVLRPPGGAPLTVAIYLDGASHPLKVRDAAIAEIGRAILAEVSR